MLSTDLKKIVAPRGWHVLNHINTSYDALVTRDPFDNLIKGLRYNIIMSDAESEFSARSYHFDFEGWCYQARGATRHQTILSFDLRERLYRDLRIENYMDNIKVFNRPLVMDEVHVVGVLKFAAEAIAHINAEKYFDWLNKLKEADLLERGFTDPLIVGEDPDMFQRVRQDSLERGAF